MHEQNLDSYVVRVRAQLPESPLVAARRADAAESTPPHTAGVAGRDDIDTDITRPAPTARESQPNGIDETAVERALAGDHITYDDLTAVEQQEVIRRLTARGASIHDIAAQLSTTKRTVFRRRASVGAA
ncbi:MAG: hypothetical protein JWP40_4788 [Blastococcus sp.]|jgi:hypothetical protein|nr:hypothetical protein [Blastococcus sp.]